MVFLFRDKSLVNIILLILLSIAVHAHLLWSPVVVSAGSPSGWFSLLASHFLPQLHPALLFVIYQVLLLSIALRLNTWLDRLRMFPGSTYLPALTLVLLSSLFPSWCQLTPALLAGHLLLWIFSRICDLPQDTQTRGALLNNGLILGISVLCYHPMLIPAIAALPAMAVVKRFRINEYLLLILGFLLPYYFFLAVAFLIDDLPSFFNQIPKFSPGWPMSLPDEITIGSLVLLVLGFFFGLAFWQQFNGRLLMQTRNNWSVLLVMVLFLIPLPFLMSKDGLSLIWLITLPMSAFFSTAFSVPRRLLLPNLFFWLLMAQAILHNWLIMKK